MSARCPRFLLLTAALFAILDAAPAQAIFHLMQIEQIIAGVNGDTSAQAIQLRMRQSGQNFISGTRLRVFDANGANPVTVMTFLESVQSGAAGSRILIASPAFNALTTPTAAPDFTMTNLIPESYLAAGSLVFESGTTVYWRVSWGGADYTGSCSGRLDNDSDGNFCPPFASPLPSCGLRALRFTGAANAASTNNAANYALTSAPATFTNNAGTSFTLDSLLAGPGGVDGDGDADLLDYRLVPPCLAGPLVLHAGCDCLDADIDADIDLVDFAAFQSSFTGA